ncbi:hypothetical protein [Pseudomonas sp. 5P_3.1_Bac2]|uniref:hypothetical protein n=1 Tax=Pseudomonas sp. 5P_3.1_Bac2 TaxID=2971617 RepID=UPI0021C8FDFB|nr:hypothetical protein [Pseudomonas sp. 5P_3.1_Bac2]MCU1719195.1 hypothetical protein [Pseudomonas sp. 5P_3.1_Bac2]
MNSREQQPQDGELSEQQRLDLLTAAGQRNRRFILGLSVALGSLMLVSVGFNFYHLWRADEGAQLHSLQQQVQRLEHQLVEQQLALTHQEQLAASQQARQVEAQLFKLENPDTIAQVSQVLQAQEQDYQQVLDGLRLGMRDLANMLAGSRSWLADYTEVIDRAQASSKKRSAAIKAWGEKAVK